MKKSNIFVKKKWSENELKRLTALYQMGTHTRDIATILGRSERSIRGQAFQKRLTHKYRNDYLYTPKEDQYIKINAKIKTRKEIAKHLGRSEGSISHRGRRLQLSFKSNKKNSLYEKNHNFFDKPTISNSYIAGLLAADGWIRPTSSNKPVYQVGISLKRSDKYILEHIKNTTGYTGKIRDFLSLNHKNSELRINGVPQWINSLQKNWNIIPVKSLTLEPPNTKLTQECLYSYLVGLMEGDGSISISNKALSIQFCSSSFQFADWIRIQWRKIVETEPTFRKNSKHHINASYSIHFYGKNARKLARKLMSVNTHQMNRKWNIAVKEISRYPFE